MHMPMRALLGRVVRSAILSSMSKTMCMSVLSRLTFRHTITGPHTHTRTHAHTPRAERTMCATAGTGDHNARSPDPNETPHSRLRSHSAHDKATKRLQQPMQCRGRNPHPPNKHNISVCVSDRQSAERHRPYTHKEPCTKIARAGTCSFLPTSQ